MRVIRKKKILKVLSGLFLSALLVTSMPQTILASENTCSITVNDSTAGHTYTAYQIFTGDYSDGKLTNIQWGSGVSNTARNILGDAPVHAEKLITDASMNPTSDVAREFADTLIGTAGYLGSGKTATYFNNKYTVSDLPVGYYLITDTTPSGVISAHIVAVVGGNVDVNPKAGAPGFEKKVQDINDSDANPVLSGLQDSADYDIGDDVPFTITITMPENYDSFKTYYLAITDDLSDGLKLNKESIKVYFDNTLIADTNGTNKNIASNPGDAVNDSYRYTLITNTNPGSDDDDFRLIIEDLKQDVSSATPYNKLIVTYTAKLTGEDVVIGNAGNPNNALLDYQRNPNYEGTVIPGGFEEDGTTEEDQLDSDKDGTPDSEENDDVNGDTDNDGILNKDDPDDNNDGIPDDKDGDGNDDDSDGDGKSDKEDEDTVLGGTEKDTVVVFTYELLVDKVKPDGAFLQGAKFTLYKYDADGTGSDTANKETGNDSHARFFKVADTESAASDATSFTFSGLDDGKYLLVETETPDGYNTINPIEFTVTASHVEMQDANNPNIVLTDLRITDVSAGANLTADVNGTTEVTRGNNAKFTLNSGQIFTRVVNKAGATLPTTGGIGTTIFYILGGVCVVVASVFLITKRIMNKKQYD